MKEMKLTMGKMMKELSSIKKKLPEEKEEKVKDLK